MVPTGNTTEIVKQYYDYLYAYYYYDMLHLRAERLLWSSPLQIFAWGAALIILLGLLTTSFYRVHRKRSELYQVMSFSGNILERNGKVTWFTWLFILGLFVAALTLGIRAIVIGYLY